MFISIEESHPFVSQQQTGIPTWLLVLFPAGSSAIAAYD
jgi:hypothetical protein